LRSAITYSAFDATALAARQGRGASQLVSSPSEAGRLLRDWSVDKPDRVDWILCTQGVAAYLIGTGTPIRVIATVYASNRTVLPVWREGNPPTAGQRTLFVPASSIELALSRFLAREQIPLSGLHIVTSQGQSLHSIADALRADVRSNDAIDFGVLTEPYLTELVHDGTRRFHLGTGGLYDMRYCVVASQQALSRSPRQFEELLRELVKADERLATAQSDDQFYALVEDGGPQLGRPITFDRTALRVELSPSVVSGLIRDELNYLVAAYPTRFVEPPDLASVVDPSPLTIVAPERVTK
jgi:hypothetical protein